MNGVRKKKVGMGGELEGGKGVNGRGERGYTVMVREGKD